MAQVIAKQTKAGFISFSAVTSGIKEIKKIMQEAEANTAYGQKTIVFVDEIHRFNKAQQDAFTVCGKWQYRLDRGQRQRIHLLRSIQRSYPD